LLDLFNTQILFRNTDSHTTEWISKVLGEKEIQEVRENVSYGADTVGDGVSLKRQERKKSIVLPTEISTLEDLQCYVKLPGGYPVTSVEMWYKGANKQAK